MKDIRSFFDVFLKFFKVITRQQRYRAIALFIMMFFGALLETVGISALIPFISALLNPQDIWNNEIWGGIARILGWKETDDIIIETGLLVVGVYLFKNLYLVGYSFFKNRFERHLELELSTSSLRFYLTKSYIYYLDINSAEILRGVQTDVTNIVNLYNQLNGLMADAMSTVFIAIFLIYTDWFMAIGVLVVTLLCAGVLSTVFRRIQKGFGVKERKLNMEGNKYIYQAVNGIKEISVMQKKEFFIEQYQQTSQKRSKILGIYYFLGAIPNRVMETVCVVAIIALISLEGRLSFVDTQIFVANLSAFALAAFKILPALGSILTGVNSIAYLKPSLDECYDNMKSALEYTQRHAYTYNTSDEQEMLQVERIELMDVSWSYPNRDKLILDKISLTINKGDSVAFIGPSGSGKTTLSDILLGLFEPNEGKILINGKELQTEIKQWANMVGFVPQSVFLLDDTIRRNIAFGVKDEEIDDRQIWRCLKQAELVGVIEELPMGLDTIVGERGVKLSGGQRQRLAIARALYRNPQVLVLDEATSALDADTESAVMKAIENLQGKMTLIVIAHRLSTIRKCDYIYEVKDAKIELKKLADII